MGEAALVHSLNSVRLDRRRRKLRQAIRRHFESSSVSQEWTYLARIQFRDNQPEFAILRPLDILHK